MPGRLLDGHKDWFTRKHKAPSQYELEDLSLEQPVDIRKLEHASRLVDKIREITLPKMKELLKRDGADAFGRSLQLCLDIASQMSNSALIDKILESDGQDAEKRWSDQAMRFHALAMLLRARF